MTHVARENIEPAFKTAVMLQPEHHPIGLPVRLDFSSVATQEFDLENPQTVGQIDFVQTIYVNNKRNANTLNIVLPGGQEIDVPAGAQGYYPVVATFGKFTMIASTAIAADLEIPIILMNVPVPSLQWGPMTFNIDNVTATFTPTLGEWQDHNGTASAGASAVLFAANPDAIRRLVQNPSTNVESFWINFGGAAASAAQVEIPPGQSFDTDTGPIDTTAWSIFAVNAIDYVAKEMTP